MLLTFLSQLMLIPRYSYTYSCMTMVIYQFLFHGNVGLPIEIKELVTNTNFANFMCCTGKTKQRASVLLFNGFQYFLTKYICTEKRTWITRKLAKISHLATKATFIVFYRTSCSTLARSIPVIKIIRNILEYVPLILITIPFCQLNRYSIV